MGNATHGLHMLWKGAHVFLSVVFPSSANESRMNSPDAAKCHKHPFPRSRRALTA